MNVSAVQGTKFVFRVTFFVQRDIVSGLAYENRVFKHGIRGDTAPVDNALSHSHKKP
mgnify:CR=1 FL=1